MSRRRALPRSCNGSRPGLHSHVLVGRSGVGDASDTRRVRTRWFTQENSSNGSHPRTRPRRRRRLHLGEDGTGSRAPGARPGRGRHVERFSALFLSVGFWLYVASFVYYRRQVRRGAVPSRSLSSLSWARPGLASRVHPKPDGAGADARRLTRTTPTAHGAGGSSTSRELAVEHCQSRDVHAGRLIFSKLHTEQLGLLALELLMAEITCVTQFAEPADRSNRSGCVSGVGVEVCVRR